MLKPNTTFIEDFFVLLKRNEDLEHQAKGAMVNAPSPKSKRKSGKVTVTRVG